MDRIEEFLRKHDAKLRRKIRAILACIAENDIAHLDIQPLKGYKGAYRCHVGNIRILFVHAGGKNVVFHMDFRGGVYKK